MSTEIEFLDQHHANLSPLERALRLDAAADAKSAAAERQESAARAAAAQERTELLQMVCRAGGISPGELQRARAVVVESDDLIRDLTDRLEKAQAKRARATENMSALTAQLDGISAAVAARSAAGMDDLLAPGAAGTPGVRGSDTGADV
jgi:chromosome condensin MukBEF ATPase and DNA-binding subunit MukB